MLLWHAAATTAIVRYTFRDERMDLRLLLVGAVLPDLIDTPIGLAAFSVFQSTRLWSHSLLFAVVAMTSILFATRRGRPRKRWMPLAVGLLVHLFLDAMWADPETLWWPLFGGEFATTPAATAAEHLGDVLSNPIVWLGEILGLGYLVTMGRRAGMGAADARRQFISTGRLDIPIGSEDR